jgi:hypothetical protein
MDPQTLTAHIVAIKRAVLMKELGRDGANLDLTIREALFDVFQTSGIGATKICYQADIQQTPTEMPGPEQPMAGSVLGLQTVPGPTQTQMIPVPVFERYRWYRFSTNKFLQPHDWHSTDFDEAPWLAMEFVERCTPAALAHYGLPANFAPNATRDDLILESGGKDPGEGSASLLKGVEIWLHAAEFDPQVAHTQVFYRLVLIEGQKEKAGVYEPSPYQTIGPDGRLTADSMIGNPIHPIALRTQADSAWPLSDAAFTDPLVRQQNTWRAQSIKARDSNVPRFLHSDRITEAIDKLKEADTGQGVAIEDELMSRGVNTFIQPLPHLENAQSDITGERNIEQDIEKTLGLGANQAGSVNPTVRSATEVATAQANVSVRLKAEQNILLERVLVGVRKFDALIQRYADQAQYVQILGAEGAKTLAMWNQHVISGRYAYDARIDSQLTIDESTRLKRLLDAVNFMAKSPYTNQAQVAREVWQAFGFDPSLMVKTPQPPPPDKPNVSFRFGGPDLALPEVRQILGMTGIQLDQTPSPQAQLLAAQQAAKNQPHGGPADKADVLSKHTSEETGAMPGQHPGAAPPASATPGRMP